MYEGKSLCGLPLLYPSHHPRKCRVSAPFAYVYTHTATEATTGYFSCEPAEPLSLNEALARLEACPMDEFLHSHVLRRMGSLPLAELEDLCSSALDAAAQDAPPLRPVLAALLLECALLNPAFAPLQQFFQPDIHTAARLLQDYSPLIFLRWHLVEDAPPHAAWSALFAANITEHRFLPHPDDEDLPPLHFPAPTLEPTPPIPTLAQLHAELKAHPAPAWSRPPAQETAARALEVLTEHAIIAGGEMRHEASLSPIALLRPWQVNIAVQNASCNYTLRGQATTYGRGLSMADARASYAMEMVERASAYPSIDAHGIVGSVRPMPLLKARLSELVAQGRAALDPNSLPLEVPYTDAPLHWLEAQGTEPGASVLVPAQCVYLFCNLDEPALMYAPGSTGLASGNTLDEARVAALTEILERDAEATTPFSKQNCFTLRSRDPRLQSLLDDYAARGIQVQFKDITTEFGVPCYQCFVRGHKGSLARATGANLNGARAALAALTEVPYPYPHGPRSGPALPHLPERILEELPDFSLESPSRNLALLEKLFRAHGLSPLYVEISRTDLHFPVVRALVPGLELGAEFDSYTRIPARLYRNYLALFPDHIA